MTAVKIDNVDYEFESLSENARSQLVSLRFVDEELKKLQAQAAVLQTARLAYANALKEALAGKVGTTLDTVELQEASKSALADQETIQTSGWKNLFKK